jgi:glycine C-acetyltransferase
MDDARSKPENGEDGAAPLARRAAIFAKLLKQRREQAGDQLDPYLRRVRSSGSGRATISDDTGVADVIQLNSANYLGLASHPTVLRESHQALERYGANICAVPVTAGSTDLHHRLERALAAFKAMDDAVLFQTGYAANSGLLTTLLEPGDHAVLDRQVHRSILDGARLSGSNCTRFGHADADDLRRVLGRIRDSDARGCILVVVEGVCGIDGDIAPLPEILAAVREYGAVLLVDECHATGIIGRDGRGLASHFEIDGQVDIVSDSLSKSLGSFGGWIGAGEAVASLLRYKAVPTTFSVGLPPVCVAAALAALEVLKSEPEHVRAIRANAAFIRERLGRSGLDSVNRSASSIMSILIGDEVRLRKVMADLFRRGVWVEGLPHPAVPRGEERIRLRINARHTRPDLERAASIIERTLNEHRIIG